MRGCRWLVTYITFAHERSTGLSIDGYCISTRSRTTPAFLPDMRPDFQFHALAGILYCRS
jgi:hypothetical protein